MKIIYSKIFKIIIVLFILGIILGIVSYFILDMEYYNNQIFNYFNGFNDNFNYLGSLFKCITYNNKYLIIIWISGILLISYLFVPLIILFNGLSIGINFTCILCSYGLKGILICLFLIIPCLLINNLIYILCSYYSLNISNKLINSIKLNKSINIKLFFKNYLFYLIIFVISLILSSLFEVYISSNLIKFVL